MRKFLAATLFCLLALSCGKDDTVYYSITEMGTVSGMTIVSDQGIVYRVKEDESKSNWWTMSRILYNCDILSKTGENTYDIRLLTVAEPWILGVDNVEADAPVVDSDPAYLYAAWEGGGYLNLGIGYLYKPKSGVEHTLALECRQKPSCDTLYLRIVHGAGGEYLKEGDKADSFKTGVRYACFPLADILAEGTTRPSVISWRYYSEDEDGNLLPAVEDFSLKGSLWR